jgi:hypothetical protein
MTNLALPTTSGAAAPAFTQRSWSAVRYAWSPGQEIRISGEGSVSCGHRVFDQGALIVLEDAPYRTRNCDLADGAEEHKTYVNSAFEIARVLSEAYAETGFVILDPLTGMDTPSAMKVVDAVLPGQPMTLRDLRKYFAGGQARQRMEASPLDAGLKQTAEEIGNLMFQAIKTAWSYQNKQLDIVEHEVTEARAGRGGRSFFDDREKHYYHQTGRKMPAETQSGTIAEIGSTIAKAVAGARGGGQSLAAVIQIVKDERDARKALEKRIEALVPRGKAPVKARTKSRQKGSDGVPGGT